MIAPDMATMLSFVFTDAPIAAPALQAMLAKSVRPLFNCDHRRQRHLDLRHADAVRDRRRRQARRARRSRRRRPAPRPRSGGRSTKLLLDLAHQVVRDGEGARKFIEVKVEGAESRKAAKRIALSIANSPLVKTAVRRRGRQLGPRRHGGRQGRREGRARQARHLVRRHPRRPRGPARSRLRRGRGLGLHEARRRS